jgi:hypothetical protein
MWRPWPTGRLMRQKKKKDNITSTEEKIWIFTTISILLECNIGENPIKMGKPI